MTDGNNRLTRRDALQGVGALVGSAALGGCSSDDEMQPTEEQPAAAELLASIETIVVVMMENRTFDHYFGSLKLAENRDVDGLTGSESNPDASGNPVGVYALGQDFTTLADPPHGWDASHAQFNGGAMDGFVTEYLSDTPDPREVMGYYTRSELPVLYTLADEYALCERWFASVMGPTWPNRYYLHCGTSNGVKTNTGISSVRSIWNLLDEAGISSAYYFGNLPFAALVGKSQENFPIDQFYTDAQAGTLPQVCYVDPVLTALDTIGNDDHPPADIRDGQAFLGGVYNALAQSPQWNKCLLAITYDEHGGYYDHVPPPTTTDDLPEFQQLGFRVPSIVVGPLVKKGFSCKTVLDHVSVLATITRRFGLEPLNARVAAAADLSVVLDPALAKSPRAPSPVPAVELSAESRTLAPGVHAGGQVELARFIERHYAGYDWRAEGRRSMRVMRDAALRLGAARLRAR